MAAGPTRAWQRELGSLFDQGSTTGISDRDLIDRFSGPRDGAAEAAFEALVARHGPMVHRVCRNVLPDPDDADDAFQATFLVLVKQRGSIRKLDSVASWLYGIALRVAARARVDAARRRRTEAHGIRLAVESGRPNEIAAALADPVECRVIQEEVRGLPERYRSVVVLCFWEGLTQEQAALRLGCPIGTVRSRMARARDLLRRRFVRRGLAPTAGGAALLLDPTASTAAVSPASLPESLVASCVQAATRVAAGAATAEVVSARIATLVRNVIWSLTMVKIKNLVLPLAAASFVVAGVSLWAQQSRGRSPEAAPRRTSTSAPSNPPATAARTRSDLAYVIEPPDLLIVEVLEALPGRPISGERLVRPDGKISLGFYGDVEVAGLTVPQAKEKIVQHLRKYLNDEVLGLVEMNPETGEPREGRKIDPKATDRVFVDVTAYNSAHVYVVGEVAAPGRFPFTGSDCVHDMLLYAGGLLPSADRGKIRLVRNFPKGSPQQVLPIDYEEITMGTDSSTNYEVRPGDRIVVYRDPKISRPLSSARGADSPDVGSDSRGDRARVYFDRGPDDDPNSTREDQRRLERRLEEMERKLDAILSRLGDRHPR